MTDSLEPLILDFLEWIARAPRNHADVMEAWRTSCPRLTVWEDAVDRGLVTRQRDGTVAVTLDGHALLRNSRRTQPIAEPAQ